VRALVPLRRIQLGLEGAAGSSFGTAPAQRLWQLGGATTVRGYGAARLRGEAFWRGSVEIGTPTPLARVALFGDVGWAGPRDDFAASRPIHAVGAGIGLLDGLLRLDLARALDPPGKWRLHLRVNGIM
jgi:hemolysin activation/secretion protein